MATQKFNPTRRGDIELDRCLCGFARKRDIWVRNGCKRHPVEALKVPAGNDLAEDTFGRIEKSNAAQSSQGGK